MLPSSPLLSLKSMGRKLPSFLRIGRSEAPCRIAMLCTTMSSTSLLLYPLDLLAPVLEHSLEVDAANGYV